MVQGLYYIFVYNDNLSVLVYKDTPSINLLRTAKNEARIKTIIFVAFLKRNLRLLGFIPFQKTNHTHVKMARSRGSARPVSRPQQTRAASTVAAPAPAAAHPPANAYSHPPAQAAQPQQPGLFAQMASTAAGVAVGSAVGHTIGAGISGMFSGSSSAPAEQAQQQVASPVQQQAYQEQTQHCDVDARNFTRCLEDNSGNMQICDYYLQQLKACQEAARQY